MRKEERYKGVIGWFEEHMPVAETELKYTDPFQLLVAVILSAQCTDKRVNMITPALFEVFPTAETMAAASPEEIFEYIKSVSYPNNKSKHLAGMARMLVSDFGGKVPSDTDELQKLPGVGRKTANVIASVLFDQPRMAVERELVQHIPEHLIAKAHHWLILHGRYTCIARRPQCERCGLTPWCRTYAQTKTVTGN